MTSHIHRPKAYSTISEELGEFFCSQCGSFKRLDLLAETKQTPIGAIRRVCKSCKEHAQKKHRKRNKVRKAYLTDNLNWIPKDDNGNI